MAYMISTTLPHLPIICAILKARPTNEQQFRGCSSLSHVELTIRNAAKVHSDGVFGNSTSLRAATANPWKREDSVSRVSNPKYCWRIALGQTTQPANTTAVYNAKKWAPGKYVVDNWARLYMMSVSSNQRYSLRPDLTRARFYLTLRGKSGRLTGASRCGSL